MKKVQVGNYTYETDLPVKVGDTVVLPTPYWLKEVKGDTWEGVVTSLESDYNGPCARIIKIKE
jgi:hypothetical protein